MAYSGKNPKFNSTTLTPQSADITVPAEGMLEVGDGTVRSKDLWLYKNSSWAKIGESGASGINYILNGNADSGTTGWATYADAAASQPVDGTGGSPTVTWTVNTSSPLRGAADFVLTKDAANRQGEGASYDFTIDTADYHTPITIKFDYAASANFSYANADVTVWVYDKTGTALIPITPNTLDGTGHFVGEFQTSASPNNTYRLILHIATTNANAYTLNVDNVQVGPSRLVYSNLQDKQYDLTVTGTNWTTTRAVGVPYKTKEGAWRLKGNIEGTVSSGVSSLNITLAGVAFKTAAGTQAAACFTENGGSYFTNANIQAGTGVIALYSGASSNTAWKVSFEAELDSQPSWATDFYPVQLGDGAETRVVAARFGGSVGSTSAGNILIFPTTSLDTHSAYNTTTGRYTVPVSGIYNISGFVEGSNGSPIYIYLYKNASQLIALEYLTTSVNYIALANVSVSLNAGDIIDVRPTGTTTMGANSYISLNRISGPATIAASEKVFCDAYRTVDQGGFTTNNSSAKVNINTVAKDSHGGFNTTNFKYTIPVSGVYDIIGSLHTEGVNIVAGRYYAQIYVNGVAVTNGSYTPTQGPASFTAIVSTKKNLMVGDYIELYVFGGPDNSSSAYTISAGSAYTFLQISKS